MNLLLKTAAGAAMLGTLTWPLADTARAQESYPSKTMRFIVPYSPGGATTVVARLLAQKLTESWGQQVIVDNRPGGNTIIGSEALVRSAPDGHTFMYVTSTHTINPSLLKTPYDALTDFAPVTTLTRSPFGLAVHPSLPTQNLREFIALARKRPGEIAYASSGLGTANHLAVELLSMHAGIKLLHVPYKGGGPAMNDLLGGQVQVHMNVPVNLIPNIKSGRIRGLAFTGENRVAALPGVPTFTEAGLPSFDATNWNGVLAPAGTPKPIIDKLSAELRRIVALPEVRERLLAQGQEPWTSTPEQFSTLLRSEVKRFAEVVRTAGIKME